MKNFIIFTFLSLIFIACNAPILPADESLTDRDPASEVGGGNSGGGNSAGTLQDAIDDAVDAPPVVEIRHLVEPKVDSVTSGGAYLKKLTIPKNYKGKLYLAGLNLSTLQGQTVKVRFKLGVNNNPITIPAEVAQVPGLTGTTAISALVMDLRNRPFSDLRLLYDLYDYNDYTFDNINSSTSLDDAVSYNRDTKLYCRGLSLEDDPTFTGNPANGCTDSDDICMYAYANVVDQGLVKTTASGQQVSLNPTRAQIQGAGSSYYADSNQEKLSRCLPSNPYTGAGGAYNYVLDNTVLFDFFGDQKTIDSEIYSLNWPFRVISPTDWKITSYSPATIGRYGLFKSSVETDLTNSFLFPRYVKYNLNSGVQYLGSADPDGVKNLETMNTSGESLWMDGCNERATTTHPVTAEHVGSCDVSASIEVFYLDVSNNNQEVTIAVSKDVKLQLVKESNEDPDDVDVVDASFQSCSATSQCGTGECCIQNRCWDKSIVSSCYEDENPTGGLVTGASCSNDYQCASLCCQGGSCGVHDTEQDDPVLCSKQVGQSCISKEWCAKQPVTRCLIVKTGVDPQGAQQCALRCYTTAESGECRNGSCTAPSQPVQPTFDETDPNRCQTACDPPDLTNGFFSSNCGN